MNLVGTWRNQYGSDVVIAADEGLIRGSFRTAIASSPFAGVDAPINGVRCGNALAFVCGLPSESGRDVVVSYTGKVEHDRPEMLWFVVDGGSDWWQLVT